MARKSYAEQNRKADAKRLRVALNKLLDVAGGYGIATPMQILNVALDCDVQPSDLEGAYFDATETAGDE